MTAKKRGLGKGLDALLGPQTEVTLAGPESQKTLPVDLIQREVDEHHACCAVITSGHP